MQLVQQRYARDCGVAVAAMISGRPYEEVLASAVRAGVFLSSGTSIARMLTILEICTGDKWTTWRPEETLPVGDQASLIRSRRPVVLLIRDADVDNRHWVGAERNFIYDPGEERRRRLGSYVRRAWELRRILTPMR